jgi:hypothetical protein
MLKFFDADLDSGWKTSARYKHPGSATQYGTGTGTVLYCTCI